METDKQQLISAIEAIEITNLKAITIENISESIRNSANNGHNSIVLINIMMPFDVMNKILSLGFLMSQTTNPFGENVIKISW